MAFYRVFGYHPDHAQNEGYESWSGGQLPWAQNLCRKLRAQGWIAHIAVLPQDDDMALICDSEEAFNKLMAFVISDITAPTPGPRKPPVQVPPEVWQASLPTPKRAWDAVQALCAPFAPKGE